jgi:DNA-binding beta-propeller fold protein YncE
LKPWHGYAFGFLLLSLSLLFAKNEPLRRKIHLPTTKVVMAPAHGHVGRINSFPATLALSPDGQYAAFLNDGYGTQATGGRQSISVLDLKNNQLSDFPDDRLGENAHQSYFIGLAFSRDASHLYASVGSLTDPVGAKPGSTGNGIAVYSFTGGKLAPERFIKIPPAKVPEGKQVAKALRQKDADTVVRYPAGIAVFFFEGKDSLLVANNLSDSVLLLDPASGQIVKEFDLSTNPLLPASFPYTVMASRDGRRAWCSLWNASSVAELDIHSGKVARWIPLLSPRDATDPGSHPTAMRLNSDESILYVALSEADAVAAVSTSTGKVMSLFDVRLPGQEIGGAYPDALALSDDGSRLFVADASLNAVAVFDTSRAIAAKGQPFAAPPALGFIPTDWYPTALAVAGGDLLIATGKGEGTGPNNGPNQVENAHYPRPHPYIATLLAGSVARIKSADLGRNDKWLAELTREVAENDLLRSDPGKLRFASGSNPIRHVIYVLKENRTYDQILGDLKIGNGDPSLTMYGAEVTPNEHALALQFGVLDNFYDSGEVSGDGHLWSTASITNEYNENTWQIAYRGKERIYDFGGTVNDEFMLDHGLPDIDDPSTGYLWDNLARHHVTYRDYGEFITGFWCKAPHAMGWPQEGTPSPFGVTCAVPTVSKGQPLPPAVGQPHASPSPYPWAIPMLKEMKATKAALRDHFDPNYPDFEVDYPDQLRVDEFLNEFNAFVLARQTNSPAQLPAFVLLYLPDDHTGGTRPSHPKPAASVADNDLALGRVVDAVSHSPYWDDTAILVVEDDAQNGYDHVDAHRSTAFVISKYSPGSTDRPYVEHGFYTTVNMIHTMEALLGLPPMNQNDAYAPLMGPEFAGPGTQPTFTANYRNRDNGLIYQVNENRAAGATESMRLDFSRPDAADAATLNAILWRDRKGYTQR